MFKKVCLQRFCFQRLPHHLKSIIVTFCCCSDADDEVAIQGDVASDVPDFLVEKFKVSLFVYFFFTGLICLVFSSYFYTCDPCHMLQIARAVIFMMRGAKKVAAFG